MAEQVRARLIMSTNDRGVTQPRPVSTKGNRDVLEERFHGKSVRSHVRSFGILFAFIFLGLALYGSNGRWTLPLNVGFISLATLFYLLGAFQPQALYPVWKAWMGLAKFLNAVVTPVLLTIVWVLMVIPISLLMRAVGVKVMDMAYDRSRESYWRSRKNPKQDFSLLERQY